MMIVSPADEALLQEFEKWRDEYDSEHVCDTFDLALGWFGKSFPGSLIPQDLAEMARDREYKREEQE